ncbi:MAG TPA: hypothetical protein VFR90_01490 [Methylibium sp.]|uniref:hypothetical protein n=1 Tax=Methylibium sp. TaxID=2067992 RepID=UPI002DBDECCF|nr:hypothetical protein [Methylibium sp.]HEU4457779.1 hypothetical protein [Methylibium sp.]
MATLESRIARLEEDAGPVASVTERLHLACVRWRAMTEEQRAAERERRVQRALEAPEPEGLLRRALWLAARRLATRKPYEPQPAEPLAPLVPLVPDCD